MASTRAGPMQPPGSSSGRSVASSGQPRGAQLCNLCSKVLATTCFLCTCDCVFCEECTYSHFEHSSQCPTCRRTLGENDFTELVVADGAGSTGQIVKASQQALFTKRSGAAILGQSDMCHSLIEQIDTAKRNTKFLLKQLLVESHRAGRTGLAASRAYESLKAENTHLKQRISSQQLQYQQTITDLQNKLQAKDATISELNQMVKKFQSHHGGGRGVGGGGGGGSSVVAHMVPNSSSVSLSSGRGSEPPLGGIMRQRQAQSIAQQNVMNGGVANKRPFMSMNRGGQPAHPGGTFRPFSSSNSSGGGSVASSAPRIRDLTANAGYHFTGVPNQNMNKRRRGGTPNSFGSGTPQHQSPTTAFANQRGMFQR